jgi:hypothetical protein
VDPELFVSAVAAGADMVEIGNFDCFYDKGIKFTAEDIITMAKKSKQLVPEVVLSVTIPHTLPLDEQVNLAIQLEAIGVDVIQTEGKMSADPSCMGVQELIEVAAPSLASAYALSKVVSIPVMCASGLTDVTANLALTMGASGVGIGSMVNKLPSLTQMVLATSMLSSSIGRARASAASAESIAHSSVASVKINQML